MSQKHCVCLDLPGAPSAQLLIVPAFLERRKQILEGLCPLIIVL